MVVGQEVLLNLSSKCSPLVCLWVRVAYKHLPFGVDCARSGDWIGGFKVFGCASFMFSCLG